MNSAKKSNTSNLHVFFNGLSPVIRIARQAQRKVDRLAATQFSLFDFFNEQEENLSRIFGEMLKPTGTHGQGDKFLYLFLDEVKKVLDIEVREGFPSTDLYDSRIDLEHQTYNRRKIDIVIRVPETRGDKWIGIENKPWAGEQTNQLRDYLDHLQKQAGSYAWLVYLSGDGSLPKTLPDNPEDKKCCCTLPFRCAKFESPSLESWLVRCISACEAERVRWFLTDLLNYIQKHFIISDPIGEENDDD
ncbi:MAG: PD-(D/E)XK nuclease family protein [Gammaproteobacteria bacterium]|nr:PD-(D/E)XK nuclease family protein [Gammaproteobacteria bacterium]